MKLYLLKTTLLKILLKKFNRAKISERENSILYVSSDI